MKNTHSTLTNGGFALSKVALALLPFTFSINTAQAADEAQADEKMERIVTIGTRVSGRTATETAAPVDLISSDQLIKTGATELGKALQTLAPSFNFSSTTVSDGSDILRPATLRGLGPDQVLVLVNGKRRHQQALVNVQETIGKGSAGYDINAIPMTAVARVEILRDGAAAQYGSDAIAGVINVVLKETTDETHVRFEAGQAYAGDGENIVAGVNTGFEFENGFINVSLEYRDRGETNRAGPATLELTDGFLIGRWHDENGNPVTRLRIGDADSENKYIWANGEFTYNDTTEFYFFGGYSDREGNSSGFFRGPGHPRVIPELYPEGFLPTLLTNVTDTSVAFGMRHDLNDIWAMDISVVTGANKFEFGSENSANVSYYYELKPDGSIYGETPTSAHDGTLKFKQHTLNIDFTGSVDWGSNDEPLYIAFGGEFRRDNYQIEAGDPWSYQYGRADDGSVDIINTDNGGITDPGIQGFPGFKPSTEVDADRDSMGLYLDLETNLTDDLSVGAAIRYEDYDFAGDNISYKLSGRWELTEDYALRGALATGFRAPGVQQIYYSQVLTNLVDGELVETGTIANNSTTAAQFGIDSLDEETSDSYSIGLVAEPIEDLELTIDYYRIDIDDRIVMSEPISAQTDDQGEVTNPEVAAILAANRLGAAQFFTNAVDTETKGLDIVAAWSTDLYGGDFDISAALGWVETDVTSIHSSSDLIPDAELFSETQVLRLEEGQPQQTKRISFNYAKDAFNYNIGFNYFGSVSGQAFTGVKQTWSSKWLVDMSVQYQYSDDITFTIGGNNIFDEFPDEWEREGNIFAQAGFTYGWETLPFGINGGYYYGRVDIKF